MLLFRSGGRGHDQSTTVQVLAMASCSTLFDEGRPRRVAVHLLHADNDLQAAVVVRHVPRPGRQRHAAGRFTSGWT